METTLTWPVVTDGFTHSVARAIREYAQSTTESNPDAFGAGRHAATCKALADFTERLDLGDPRWILLLRQSRDSDRFDALSGKAQEFLSRLALDRPSSGDSSADFTEFCVAVASSRPVPTPEESAAVSKLRAQVESNQRATTEREAKLQAEIDRREKEHLELCQEASDLRGERERWRRNGGDEADKLSRRVGELEGLVAQADARAAAAESKLNRRAKKVKV